MHRCPNASVKKTHLKWHLYCKCTREWENTEYKSFSCTVTFQVLLVLNKTEKKASAYETQKALKSILVKRSTQKSVWAQSFILFVCAWRNVKVCNILQFYKLFSYVVTMCILAKNSHSIRPTVQYRIKSFTPQRPGTFQSLRILSIFFQKSIKKSNALSFSKSPSRIDHEYIFKALDGSHSCSGWCISTFERRHMRVWEFFSLALYTIVPGFESSCQ